MVQRTFFTMPLTKDLYGRMSAKNWSEWRWAFSFSGVENWLLHIMRGTKRLNPFLRLHEASEILNKYVMGVWQARRQDFAVRGAKNHKGVNVFIQYWMYAATGGQTWNGVLDTTGPALATIRECGQIHRCLFGKFHCDCFSSWQCRSSPNLPPQNAYRGPQWWFLPRPNELRNKMS